MFTAHAFHARYANAKSWLFIFKTSARAKFAVNCTSNICSFGWRVDRQKVVTCKRLNKIMV